MSITKKDFDNESSKLAQQILNMPQQNISNLVSTLQAKRNVEVNKPVEREKDYEP